MKRDGTGSVKVMAFFLHLKIRSCSESFLVMAFLIVISDLIPPSEVNGESTYESVVGKEAVLSTESLKPYQCSKLFVFQSQIL